MTWENTPKEFAERSHRGLLPQRRGSARELHDTLLQGFLGASMQLCFVDDGLPDDSPAKPILRRALDLIRKALDEGRNVLLGLRSVASPDGSIEKALGDIPEAFAPGSAARLSIVILGESRPLIPAVQDQVHWIAREALLNALRHSGASRVEAEIEYRPRKLRVVIRDDGTGIDPVALRIARMRSHWGLSGMQERAASMGAKVRVWSKRGQGTEVEISLPILGKSA